MNDNQIETRITNLEINVSKITLLVDRLDKAIDKLTSISNDVSVLLATQTTKLELQEKLSESVKKEVKDFLDNFVERYEEKIKKIDERLRFVEKHIWKFSGFFIAMNALIYIVWHFKIFP